MTPDASRTPGPHDGSPGREDAPGGVHPSQDDVVVPRRPATPDARRAGESRADNGHAPDQPPLHASTVTADQATGTADGVPIVGPRTAWWTLAGLLAGAVTGALVGAAYADGRLELPRLAPVVAGGAGVAGFVFATALGALLGLAGAVAGTVVESRGAGDTAARDDSPPHQSSHGGSASHTGGRQNDRGKHAGSSALQRLPILGSVAIALFMAYTLYVIASRALGAGEPSDQANRIHWNQKNATRVGGVRDEETALAVLRASYPATRAENRPQAVFRVRDDWREALAATPLIARPVNAAVVIDGVLGDAAATDRELARLAGTPTAGDVAPSVVLADSLGTRDPAEFAARVDELVTRAAGGVPSENVILVASDADARWALPAGAYAARAGTPVLFVTADGVPAATTAALERRGRRARIFVLGPADAVPESIVDRLRSYGTVTRIAGRGPIDNAVRFAEFWDPRANFGWGYDGLGTPQRAVVNSILVSAGRWQDAVMAAHLAHRGKSGALLLTEGNRLPAAVDRHLWRQRPKFSNSPAEGPFNHVWAVGSFARLGYLPQAWADYSQEIEQYMTLGDSAMSGLEALGFAWIALAIASAAWIAFHAHRQLPRVMPMMKAAWAVFALLLGPVAVWLYLRSYHRRPTSEHEGMTMWHRPMWLQVVSATVMMFAFDMILMVLAVFALAYIGFPIIPMENPAYIVGTSMFLMMVLMYVIAFIIMCLVFHTPMWMHEYETDRYWRALVAGLPIMFYTMTIESVGMMPTMWWAQMSYLPGMQMPTDDDFTMWVTLLIASAVGFLVVLPFNYAMVKRGKKMGMM